MPETSAGLRDAPSAPAWLEQKPLGSLPDLLDPTTIRLAELRGTLVLFGSLAGEAGADRIWAWTPPPLHGDSTDARAAGPVDAADEAWTWRVLGRLPSGVRGATVVTSATELVCLGGWTNEGPSDRVFRIHTEPGGTSWKIEADLPRMPKACGDVSAAAIGSRVYVAGGRSDRGVFNTLWMLDLADSSPTAGWQEQPPWPGPPRCSAALVAQNNGEHFCLFLFGGLDSQEAPLSDAYRFDPVAGRWQTLTPIPRTPVLRSAVRVGQTHILLTGEPQLGYHTITDAWSQPDRETAPLAAVVPWAGELALVVLPSEWKTSPTLYRAWLRQTRRELGTLDFVVLASYLGLLVAVGFYFSRREGSTAQFFLGGQRIPWWAAGLSLLATQVSSIGFMAVPAKSFSTDWAYFAGVFTWFLVVPLVTAVYIPLFRQLNVTSAYEYLEARFNLLVRLFGATAYSFLQLGRMAVVLFLPALALSAVTGLDHRACILVMGVLCTVYTVAGGIEAVVWTDVFQAMVLVGGALLCVAVVLAGIDGGPVRFWELAAADDKFRLGHFDRDIATASVWVIVLGNLFIRLAGLTSDQAIVQRYMTTTDARQSIRALWADVAVSIPWALIAFSFGTALYVFYKLRPELLSPSVDLDGVVPLFVAQQLPAGISGLIIAAIFAAAMSSLDSSMHSTATVWVTDFYRRLRPHSSDRACLRLARLLTIALGVFGTLSALALAETEIHSLWDLFQGIVGLFSGGLAGLFVLGLFTRRAHGRGAVVGAVASAALLYRAQPHVHFFLYPVIGVLSCVLIGYAASRVLPGKARTAGLTVYTLRD